MCYCIVNHFNSTIDYCFDNYTNKLHYILFNMKKRCKFVMFTIKALKNYCSCTYLAFRRRKKILYLRRSPFNWKERTGVKRYVFSK